MNNYRIDYYADVWSCELLHREYVKAATEDIAKNIGIDRMKLFNSKYITCNRVKGG